MATGGSMGKNISIGEKRGKNRRFTGEHLKLITRRVRMTRTAVVGTSKVGKRGWWGEQLPAEGNTFLEERKGKRGGESPPNLVRAE